MSDRWLREVTLFGPAAEVRARASRPGTRPASIPSSWFLVHQGRPDGRLPGSHGGPALMNAPAVDTTPGSACRCRKPSSPSGPSGASAPDPIPVADLRLIIEAAVRAPNGGNQQVGRLPRPHRPRRDPRVRQRSTARPGGPSAGTTTSGRSPRTSRPTTRTIARPWPGGVHEGRALHRAGLLDRIGGANSVIPAVQNLMLARARWASARCPPRCTPR